MSRRLKRLEIALKRIGTRRPEGVGVGVHEWDWEKVLKRLGRMQDVGTDFPLKEKTIDKS